MTFNHSINGTNSNEQKISDAWTEYGKQFNYVQEHKTIEGYAESFGKRPPKDYPNMEQYVAWNELIKVIGGENFNLENLIKAFDWQIVEQESDDIFLINNFDKLFTNKENLELFFSCGYFWRDDKKNNRRDILLEFIANNMKENNWGVTIYAQDTQLEGEFINKYQVKPNITIVNVRINVHYIVVKNRSYMENSHIFLEMPHTERYFPRLDTCISFGDVQRRFNGKIIELLGFLDSKRKENL